MDTGNGLSASVPEDDLSMKSDGTSVRQWRQVFQGNVFAFGLVSFLTDLSTEMIYPLLPAFFSGLVPSAAVAVYIGLGAGGRATITTGLLKLKGNKIGVFLPYIFFFIPKMVAIRNIPQYWYCE